MTFLDIKRSMTGCKCVNKAKESQTSNSKNVNWPAREMHLGFVSRKSCHVTRHAVTHCLCCRPPSLPSHVGKCLAPSIDILTRRVTRVTGSIRNVHNNGRRGSIIIWHRHQKHFHSGKICVKNNRITAAHVSVLSECHDYADWIIMCRVNTMQSRWKVRVLKLKAVKAKIWRGAGSQYFTNNLWPGCLVWSWGELASAALAVNDLLSFWSELISKSVAFVGGPTMVQELEAMRMNSSVARRGPHFGRFAGCHKYPSLYMFRFLLPIFWKPWISFRVQNYTRSANWQIVQQRLTEDPGR